MLLKSCVSQPTNLIVVQHVQASCCACSTPDFATPQDQQYDITVDASDPSAVAMRSPAALSPNRIKRPRNAGWPHLV